MAQTRTTFAEAWKDEFDRMSAEVDWFAMTVAGRARILNKFNEDATRRAALRVRRGDVLRYGSADIASIERKFVRRAHRLGVTRHDLRQFE
jgi:hypothetical protein